MQWKIFEYIIQLIKVISIVILFKILYHNLSHPQLKMQQTNKKYKGKAKYLYFHSTEDLSNGFY